MNPLNILIVSLLAFCVITANAVAEDAPAVRILLLTKSSGF